MHEMTNHILCAFGLPRATFSGNKYNLVFPRLLELSVGVVCHPEKMRRLVGTYGEILVVIMVL